MATITKTDQNALQTSVTVNLTPEDYLPVFEQELLRYRKQSQLKGFRKGKTPNSMLKKMYGKSLMAEVINDMLQEKLYGYIREQGLHILGSPLPSAEQEIPEFDLQNPSAYTVQFDLGLEPDFEVKPLTGVSFTKYVPEIPEAEVQKELERVRLYLGERTQVDSAAEADDSLLLRVQEILTEPADADSAIEPAESEFEVVLGSVTDAAREMLQEKKPGETFSVALSDLLPNATEEQIRKDILNLEEGDNRELSPLF